MYCSGAQNAILTGMSFDVSNPDIDPPEYARAKRIFFMFLNVRRDNQRNWISNKFNALSTLGNRIESKGSFIHEQRIHLIIIMFFFLKC